jgi:hypothetical protein
VRRVFWKLRRVIIVVDNTSKINSMVLGNRLDGRE